MGVGGEQEQGVFREVPVLKDKLTDFCGNRLLQNGFIDVMCKIKVDWGVSRNKALFEKCGFRASMSEFHVSSSSADSTLFSPMPDKWCGRCLMSAVSRNKAFFEKCGFRALQTLEVTSEDAPTLKINVMTRVPFPKSIELS